MDSSLPASAIMSSEVGNNGNLYFSPSPPSLLRRRAFSSSESGDDDDDDNDDGDDYMNNSGRHQYHHSPRPLLRQERGELICKIEIMKGEENADEFSSPTPSASTTVAADSSSATAIGPPHATIHVENDRTCTKNNTNHDCHSRFGEFEGNSCDGGGNSFSHLSFSTPIRPITPAASITTGRNCKAATKPNRERANTCPRNRSTFTASTRIPLRHTTFFYHPQDDDEEDDLDNTAGTGEGSSDEESIHMSRRISRRSHGRDAFTTHSLLSSTANSPQSIMNTASHNITIHRIAINNSPTIVSSSSPLSVSSTTQRTPHHSVHLSSSSSSLLVLPHPPASTITPSEWTSASQGTNGAATTIATTATNTSDCLLRIHPTFMKLFMFLSLYLLLSYTWKSDLQYRYQSMDINYGLSEYWHGGLGSKIGMVEKIGKGNRDDGRLFNDDEADGGGIAKLLLLGNGDENDGAATAVARKDDADDIDSYKHGNDGILLPLLRQQHQQGVDASRNKKLKPSLSYARSIFINRNAPKATASARRRKTTLTTKKKWSLSNILWAILSFILMIPIMEASIGEIRRRVVTLYIFRPNNNVYARYYPRWRQLFRGGWGGGGTVITSATFAGRVRNVHNL